MSIVSLQADEALPVWGQSLVQRIMENEHHCVQAFDGDKIFLQSERIVSTKNGLFLSLNEKEYCHLPFLESNEKGCFLSLSMLFAKEVKRCPWCFIPVDGDGICQNGSCGLYGKKAA